MNSQFSLVAKKTLLNFKNKLKCYGYSPHQPSKSRLFTRFQQQSATTQLI